MATISSHDQPDHSDAPHQQGLDDTIESTFPASDPLSTIPDPVPDPEHTGERKEPLELDS